jgi:hypothetical protein
MGKQELQVEEGTQKPHGVAWFETIVHIAIILSVLVILWTSVVVDLVLNMLAVFDVFQEFETY